MFWFIRGRRGRMVVEFTTTCAISTYHHYRCELETHSSDTTLFDKVCQWLTAGRWFTPGTLVSSTNKTDPPRYNWNIVKSGVKHHKPNQPNDLYIILTDDDMLSYSTKLM